MNCIELRLVIVGELMNNEDLLENIELIREKANNKKLVVFVGSGVSRNTKGMSSWYGIIDKMASSINYSRCTYCTYKHKKCKESCKFKREYSTDEFLKIPQYLFNKNKKKYWEILNECIAKSVDAPLSSTIFEINPAHIITTNYDDLLESSSHVYRKQYDVIIEDKDLLSADKCKYIIKMHGDLKCPQTVVLKEQDYLDYSQNHILVELFIKSLLTNHTFLFLGYSLNDYNIKLIISWLNYMRSENKVFDKNHRVGYIVFNKPINKTQLLYFEKNNIGVIIINNIPMVSNIPESISEEMGKQLFSFLQIVSDSSLDTLLFAEASLNKTIAFIKHHSFITYKSLLKLLQIKKYDFSNGNIKLFEDSDYYRIEKCLNSEGEKSKELRRLLLNAGIESIENVSKSNWRNPKKIICGIFESSELFNNDFYKLYIENNFDILLNLLDKTEGHILEKCFYYSIIKGYEFSFSELNKIDLNTLDTDQQIATLHNIASLEALKTYSFSPTQVIRFIDNITSQNVKEVYSSYIVLYDGNPQEQLVENKSYTNITSTAGNGIINDLFRLKKVAITEYCFFFYNNLFFNGFSNLKSILKPYISAVLYLSSSKKTKKIDVLGSIENHSSSYNPTKLDFDMITKFITTKELFEIVKDHNINDISVPEDIKSHLINCFCNLTRSICETKNYGYRLSFINTISNLAIIINRINISEDLIVKVSESVSKLFSSEEFDYYFFSVAYQNWRECLNAFSELMRKLTITPNFNIIRYLLSSDNFFDYSVNVDFRSLRTITNAFINNNSDFQTEIKKIVDSENDFNRKIIILRLFYRNIVDEKIKKYYINFLSTNYSKLPSNALYDFVFSKWIQPSKDDLKSLFSDIIKMQHDREFEESKGIYLYPNYVDIKLEQIYLFYINEIIKDISPLSVISEKKPHLQFLLNPCSFNYSIVDFSDYMWLNFARIPKYLNKFIEHRNEILPRLKEHYELGIITNEEMKILFRYMVNDKELWLL